MINLKLQQQLRSQVNYFEQNFNLLNTFKHKSVSMLFQCCGVESVFLLCICVHVEGVKVKCCKCSNQVFVLLPPLCKSRQEVAECWLNCFSVVGLIPLSFLHFGTFSPACLPLYIRYTVKSASLSLKGHRWRQTVPCVSVRAFVFADIVRVRVRAPALPEPMTDASAALQLTGPRMKRTASQMAPSVLIILPSLPQQ